MQRQDSSDSLLNTAYLSQREMLAMSQYLSRDDIEPLLTYLRGKKIGSKAIAEFVIHYAVLDCTPAWIEDIPNIEKS